MMQSTRQINQFTRMGDYVLISFNERLVESEEEPQYAYDSTKVKLMATRADVIQALMRIKYKDMESEFAARINGGEEELTHSQWREQAKLIADEFEVAAAEMLNSN